MAPRQLGNIVLQLEVFECKQRPNQTLLDANFTLCVMLYSSTTWARGLARGVMSSNNRHHRAGRRGNVSMCCSGLFLSALLYKLRGELSNGHGGNGVPVVDQRLVAHRAPTSGGDPDP